MEIKAYNIDSALVLIAEKLLKYGIPRETRGFKCFEIPEPVLLTISQPMQRYVFNPLRKWNKYLPFTESLWILNGVNGLDVVGAAVKNLYNFSDDGSTMRAGYGPRLRQYNGNKTDYNFIEPSLYRKQSRSTDQLKFVVETLKKSPDSRQAVITIADPVKDCFGIDGKLKQTKDQPCTRLIQFMIVNGKLDTTVYMRSNDFIWGLSAVNIFNFTLLQEVVAGLIGVEVGRYHHFIDNLHYYEDMKPMVESIAKITEDVRFKAEGFRLSYFKTPKQYDFNGITLEQFDVLLVQAYKETKNMIAGKQFTGYTGNQLIDDILTVMRIRFAGLKPIEANFHNKLIENLFIL